MATSTISPPPSAGKSLQQRARVFVSSTSLDMQSERQALREALRKLSDVDFAGMEDWGASPQPPVQVCLERVRESDLYVGIFGARYGWVDPASGRSMTELEYRQAAGDGKPCLIYLREDAGEEDPRLAALKAELTRERTVAFYRSPEELATRVVIDVHNHLQGSPAVESPSWRSKWLASIVLMTIGVGGYVLWPGKGRSPAEGLYLEGQGLVDRSSRFNDAIPVLEKALTLDPKHGPSHAALSQAYSLKYAATRDTQWLMKAKASGEAAVKRMGESANTDAALGLIAQQEARPDEAAKRFQRVVEREPQNYAGWLRLGRAYNDTGNVPASEAAYQSAIRLNKEDPRAYKGLAFMYCYVQKDCVKAADALENVRRLAPEDHKALTMLGAIHLKKGNLPEAETAFEQSVALSPNAEGFNNLCTIYFYQRRYQDASRLCAQAAALDSGPDFLGGSATAYQFAGEAAKASEIRKRAIAAARRRLASSRSDFKTWASLGRILAQAGDHAEAARAIEMAQKQAPPGDAHFLSAAVKVYELAGQRHRALAFYRALAKMGEGIEVRLDPELVGLQADERFQEVQ